MVLVAQESMLSQEKNLINSVVGWVTRILGALFWYFCSGKSSALLSVPFLSLSHLLAPKFCSEFLLPENLPISVVVGVARILGALFWHSCLGRLIGHPFVLFLHIPLIVIPKLCSYLICRILCQGSTLRRRFGSCQRAKSTLYFNPILLWRLLPLRSFTGRRFLVISPMSHWTGATE